MTAVTRFPAPRRAQAAQPLFLFDARRPTAPASAAMIEQVITHADLCVRLSGGRLKLRVSAEAVAALQAEGRLDSEATRLTDLTVVWNEAEGQVAAVRDDARLRDAARFTDWDDLWDEASYAPAAEPRAAAA